MNQFIFKNKNTARQHVAKRIKLLKRQILEHLNILDKGDILSVSVKFEMEYYDEQNTN